VGLVILSAAKNLRRSLGSLLFAKSKCMRIMPRRQYHVYIMASLSRTMYVGVTNDLAARAFQHRTKVLRGFTTKYSVTRLVHAEEFSDVRDAIAREKQIKGWRRERKVALIESANPEWEDLSGTWFVAEQDPSLRSGRQAVPAPASEGRRVGRRRCRSW